MGVTGLWQIVQPCARPIKIETLNRKRLAVDASIWIYQFLKAVRDKEGNALRNSHVVGFFRRICKLLFFGIKPVFVFDGGAPALKRQTISARKSRREGRREDAVRTAGKLLAVQMQRRAEEEEAKRKASRDRPDQEEEEVRDEDIVYIDELQMTQQERQRNRKFRKKDAYHLPELDVSMAQMGGPNDPRIMSLEELQAYARQFDTGEDINVYDFSKIDYDSPFFTSLPASDRYNILNAARLRSRLRMGHSKEQLESMFPDRMTFSRFQIERVQERNELTQRLMHLNGFEDTTFGLNGAGRIAGEKGREYVLIKNDGVEGGWALGVISDEGREEKPIDIDKPEAKATADVDEEWEEDDEFEDVPIEGLNRLPKLYQPANPIDQLTKQRKALYRSRQRGAKGPKKVQATKPDTNSLFVQENEEEQAEEADWEEIDNQNSAIDGAEGSDHDDEDLQRAIALSLGQDGDTEAQPSASEEEDDMEEVFHQSAAAEQKPLPRGSGRAIANIVNKRAFQAAPESREITSFGVPVPKPDDSDSDDSMDLQAALAESRKTKRKISPSQRPEAPSKPAASTAGEIAKKAGFSGPLPFEKLDLGSSLLGKKKMQQRSEETAGGFENPELAKKEQKKTEPLPPWFTGDLEKGLDAQKALEQEGREQAKEFSKQFQFQERPTAALRPADSDLVIDLEADEPSKPFADGEVIDLDSDQSVAGETGEKVVVDEKLRMGDLAEKLRVEPPSSEPGPQADTLTRPDVRLKPKSAETGGIEPMNPDADAIMQDDALEKDGEMIDWSESDGETPLPLESRHGPESKVTGSRLKDANELAGAEAPFSQSILGHAGRTASEDRKSSRSPSPEFEDVEIPDTVAPQPRAPSIDDSIDEVGEVSQVAPASGLAPQHLADDDDEFDDFSDPEEQEMLRALTLETEEHARFASSLNNKPQAQNILEYEQELKQLRNQQKKDRRDADEVTHIMISECQQLLRLFGIPYITAPMEAEAQCAELVHLGLVDGIVTDDSDCFLFGGTRIYKNMFNQAKYVECYLSSDLKKEFDLDREKMISIAHLLGSDYTEGLPGVGPVTALEIISEFGDLDEFRKWWEGVQMNQIPRSEDADKPFRKKFRRNASKLFLPAGFPDARVKLAYTNPEVDSDPEAFQWGVPDLDALRSFLMTTIGWSQERTDEILLPVIKDMNRRMDEGTQANITAFFDGSVGIGAAGRTNSTRTEGFAPRKRVEASKRMGNALKRMAERARSQGDDSAAGDSAADPSTLAPSDPLAPQTGTKQSRKRRKTTKQSDVDADGDSSSVPVDEEGDGDFVGTAKSASKRSKAKK